MSKFKPFKNERDIFEPTSTILTLDQVCGNVSEKLPFIVIPENIMKKLGLNVNDQLIWESYQGEIIRLKVKKI